MLSAFQKYLDWHASVTARASEDGFLPVDASYFRWVCPDGVRDCAGLGDRFRGAINGLFTAIALKRVFILPAEEKFHSDATFAEVSLKWNLLPHPNASVVERYLHIWDRCPGPNCDRDNLTNIAQHVGIRVAFRSNPLVLPQYASQWGCSPNETEIISKVLASTSFQRKVAQKVFAILPATKKKLQAFLSRNGIEERYIALHLRTGRGTGEAHLDRFSDLLDSNRTSRAVLRCLVEALECPSASSLWGSTSPSHTSDAKIVFASDDPVITRDLPGMARAVHNLTIVPSETGTGRHVFVSTSLSARFPPEKARALNVDLLESTMFDMALLAGSSLIISTGSHMSLASFVLGNSHALLGARRSQVLSSCSAFWAKNDSQTNAPCYR